MSNAALAKHDLRLMREARGVAAENDSLSSSWA